MNVDEVITLANNKEYLLLLENEEVKPNERYFLAVLLNDKNEPTDEYVVLKEIRQDGKILSQKINDTIILNELLNDFKSQYEDDYE